MKKVKVYSTPTCPFCQLAKKFLTENNIEYEDIDVSVNKEKAEDMVELSGQIGVPVIVIDEEIIVGFDEAKVKEALEV